MASRFSNLRGAALLAAVIPCGTAHAEEAAAQRTLRWNAHPEGEAAADSAERSEKKPEGSGDAASAVDEGHLMPFSMGASISRSTVVAKSLGGYDSASSSARLRTAAEASIANIVALRLDYEHGPATGTNDRVVVGARMGLLRQDKHGINGGFGFFYDAKDFRNEGNVIGGLFVGREFGRFGLNANALFGMDTEGDDASADVRLGAGYRMTPWFHLGLDARGRTNFSSDSKRANAQAINWELQTGPTASFSFGPVALLAMVGPSLLRVTDPGATTSHTNAGVLAFGGAGAAF